VQDQIAFPRDVDSPSRILFWTVDQIVPFSAMAVIGMLVGSLFTFSVLGIALAWGMSKFRDSKPDGYLQHWVYWYGVLPIKGRTAINPFLRSIRPL
jgi:conjugal transfer pilus assembly protein TraL